MADGEELQKRRFCELAERAQQYSICTFTDFLGLAEQSLLAEVREKIPGRQTAWGGADGCERVMVRFGDPEEMGYETPFPIAVLRAVPRAPKFAEELTHRDFLGALLNLGVERDVLGDIVVRDGETYLFCREDMASFLCEGLTRVRHTDIRLSPVESLPEGQLYRTEPLLLKAMSERLDGVIAKAMNLSREEASALFRRGLVFLNGKQQESGGRVPKSGDIISVRGYGRLRYCGYQSDTKKGKMNLLVEKFV